MKALLFSVFTLAGLPLLAQTSTTTTSSTSSTTTTPSQVQAPPSQSAMMAEVMSTLTPTEKNQLMTARQKALTDNPELQTKGMDLMQKGMALQSGTATDADKQAFRTEATAYGAEVRTAMVKADPAVGPILQKVEAQEVKMRAEYGH
jgi:hypothetical protein